jgi:hypothetical protein
VTEYKTVTTEEANNLPHGSVILGVRSGAIAITRLEDRWSHCRDLAHGKYYVLYVPPPELPKVGDVLDRVTPDLLDTLPIHTVLMDVTHDIVVKRSDERWSPVERTYSEDAEGTNSYLTIPVRVIYMPDQLDEKDPT